MKKYLGQEKLFKLHSMVKACTKLEGDMIYNLHLDQSERPNAYSDAVDKLYKSDFVTWLKNQEHFKNAKKLLIENNITINAKQSESNFFVSFEHLCLLFFDLITHIVYTKNEGHYLSGRKKELKKAQDYINRAIAITYPKNYIPDVFVEGKKIIEEEINHVDSLKYRDKPGLLRTIMIDSFMKDILTLYQSKLKHITPTILTEVTLCIINLIFDDKEITKEYLMKKASAAIKKHQETIQCT